MPDSEENIVLSMPVTICGIKHAGKSSAAAALARLTGAQRADTDEELQKEYNEANGTTFTIRGIFHTLGEDEFRRREAAIVRRVSAERPCRIISLGGGALNNPYLSDADKAELGFLCCIDVPDLVAFKRVLRKGLPPFLINEKNPLAVFSEQNEQRRRIFRQYAKAIITIPDGKTTPDENARRILLAYKEFCKK